MKKKGAPETHTPGPWLMHWGREQSDSVSVVTADQKKLIAVVSQEGNGLLIASAPDLLSALEGVVNHPTKQESYINARAAIAKARG